MCVEFVPLWSVSIWDKKFNAVDREKQPVTYSYKYLLASELSALEIPGGDVFMLSTGKKTGWTTEEMAEGYIAEGEIVSIPGGGSADEDTIKYYKGRFVTSDNRIMTSNDTNRLLNKYLYYWALNSAEIINSFYRGGALKHPDMAKVLDMLIPVPPIPVQQEIVRILDKFSELTKELTKELALRRKQYQYYFNKLMTFEGVEWIALEDLFDTRNGYTPSKSCAEYWENGSISWFRLDDIRANGRILSQSIQRVTPDAVKGELFPANSIIITTSATIGEHALITSDFIANQRFTCLTLKPEYREKYSMMFLFYYCFELGRYCRANTHKGSFESVDMGKFRKFRFPVISLEEQHRIASILDRFNTMCTSLTQGLPAEIQDRKKQYAYYRDKLLTFEPLKKD